MKTNLILTAREQRLIARCIQTALWGSNAYTDDEKRRLIEILVDIRANTDFEIDDWVLAVASNLGMKV